MLDIVSGLACRRHLLLSFKNEGNFSKFWVSQELESSSTNFAIADAFVAVNVRALLRFESFAWMTLSRERPIVLSNCRRVSSRDFLVEVGSRQQKHDMYQGRLRHASGAILSMRWSIVAISSNVSPRQVPWPAVVSMRIPLPSFFVRRSDSMIPSAARYSNGTVLLPAAPGCATTMEYQEDLLALIPSRVLVLIFPERVISDAGLMGTNHGQ